MNYNKCNRLSETPESISGTGIVRGCLLGVVIWVFVFIIGFIGYMLIKQEKRIETLEFTVNQQKRTILTQDTKIRELHKRLDTEKKLRESQVTQTSRGSNRRVLTTMQNFEVTWYNDKGITKSGRDAVSGVSVAVDPEVIELGTWLEIELPNGQKLIRRADDTGSKVKGKVIDIHSDASTEELRKRGRTRNVTVRILDTGFTGGA